jgi:aspartyl-tRNA(Asn)/glutamyl-tRNA(Gln) amidotransferase subunit A
MTSALHFLTIAEASQQIKARTLSPLEYVDHLAQRIEAIDPQINSFITPTFELARTQAKKAEAEITAGNYRGPMHGIPFGAKDIYETAGILTTGGSRIAQHHIPTHDATTITNMRNAGAVLLGKLNTHEFAHGGPSFDVPWPIVRNPWNLEYFSGGSSSGSGASVAAGLIPGALGTDTGGSIRGPASLCGIAGFMPSSGLVSRTGVMPNSFTLDHCGPMAWTVKDCAIMLQALAGYDPADGNSFVQDIPDYSNGLDGNLKGLRVGVLRYVWESDLPISADHQEALNNTVKVLKDLGATVSDCRLRPMQEYMDVKVVLAETEIFTTQQQGLIERPGDYGQDFLTRILPAVMFQSTDFVAATREHRRMLHEMTPIYEKFDILLMPSFGAAKPITAHRPISFWKGANAQVLANITAGPALAMTCGFNASGLPMGLQLVGPPLQDARVLKVGHILEGALALRGERPKLTAGRTAPVLTAPDITPDASHCDAQTRDFAHRMARNAGLRLNDDLLEVLFEAAPYALEMTRRLQKNRNWFDEPANNFRPGAR